MRQRIEAVLFRSSVTTRRAPLYWSLEETRQLAWLRTVRSMSRAWEKMAVLPACLDSTPSISLNYSGLSTSLLLPQFFVSSSCKHEQLIKIAVAAFPAYPYPSRFGDPIED